MRWSDDEIEAKRQRYLAKGHCTKNHPLRPDTIRLNGTDGNWRCIECGREANRRQRKRIDVEWWCSLCKGAIVKAIHRAKAERQGLALCSCEDSFPGWNEQPAKLGDDDDHFALMHDSVTVMATCDGRWSVVGIDSYEGEVVDDKDADKWAIYVGNDLDMGLEAYEMDEFFQEDYSTRQKAMQAVEDWYAARTLPITSAISYLQEMRAELANDR